MHNEGRMLKSYQQAMPTHVVMATIQTYTRIVQTFLDIDDFATSWQGCSSGIHAVHRCARAKGLLSVTMAWNIPR